MRGLAWVAVGLCVAALGTWAEEGDGLPLVYENDFEEGLGEWVMTDADAWERLEVEGNHVLALTGKSKYMPPVRSPLNIARVAGLEVTDFAIEADLKQTGREYEHRDLCIFFGYQDPSHFYYVHLATVADPHANSVFLVDGEPRVSIALERTDGTKWGQGVHKVRIERDVEEGTILVYFDDMDTPAMKAKDKHFLHGSLGFGSFDDTGHFDNVRVWGRRVVEE